MRKVICKYIFKRDIYPRKMPRSVIKEKFRGSISDPSICKIGKHTYL